MHWVRELYPNLPDLLADIRQRPGIFLGCKSIEGMQHLLGGIQLAEDLHDIPLDSRFSGFDFTAFEEWVDRTFNTERLSVRSFYLSQHLAGSDSAGFDLWFEWYDHFCAITAAAGHV